MSLTGKLASIKQALIQSDLGRRMASGTSWVFAGTVASKVLTLLAGILLARYVLDKESYGQYGMVKSTINMFMIVGSAGMGLMATKYIAEYRLQNKERIPSIYMLTVVFSLVLAMVIGVLVLSLSKVLAINALAAPELVPSLKIAALALVFIIYNYAQEGALSGFEDFKAKAINGFVMSSIQALAILGGGYWGVRYLQDGVLGSVIGFSVAYILLIVLDQLSIKKNFRKLDLNPSIHSIEKKDVKLLFTFTLPATISSLLAVPGFWMIRTLLKNATGSFEDVADYDVADQWRMLMLFIPAMVSQVALPVLSSIERGDKNKFWRVLNVNLSLNMAIALVGALAISLLSGVILTFYGERYTNTLPMVILAGSCVFNAASNLFGVAITSLSRMWQWCGFNILWAVTMVVLTIVFLHSGMGATGVALAVLLAYSLHAIVQYIYLRVVY